MDAQIERNLYWAQCSLAGNAVARLIGYFVIFVGMHYYNHTEPKAIYEQTVLDIKDNGEQMKLPYR